MDAGEGRSLTCVGTDTVHTHTVGFDLDRAAVNPTSGLLEFSSTLDSIYRNDSISSIKVIGSASPEGRAAYNYALAFRRAEAMARFLSAGSGVPFDRFSIASIGEDWNGLAERMPDVLDRSDCNRIAGIIATTSDVDAREAALRALDGGRVWSVLSSRVFPLLRRAVVEVPLRSGGIYTYMIDSTGHSEVGVAPSVPVEPVVPVVPSEVETESAIPVVDDTPSALCARSWHLSTNALEWALLISNLTGEYDFSCRWSAALSLHYSAINYGSVKRKFRTLMVRPEVRYWFSDGHEGLFADLHLSVASYNFALSSWKYRVQDAAGHHPALGGGLGIGYRCPLGGSRWSFQAQVGVGVYHLKYDRFENRLDGPLVDTRTRVWAGIDNVSLSLVYNFKTFSR